MSETATQMLQQVKSAPDAITEAPGGLQPIRSAPANTSGQPRARSSVRSAGPSGRPVAYSRESVVKEEETEEQRIHRLGRSRPPQFNSWGEEAAFCYSVLASQVLSEYFVSGFNVLVPTLLTSLNIQRNAATWPAASFALVTSSFLLPFGRLADMFGGFPVFLGGLIWFCIWSLIAGFSQNELMLNWCRAMQGFGPAAFLPSGTGLIGKTYRPGPRKNLVFSLYGASAVIGFFGGIFVAGVATSFLGFRWYFWIGAVLVFTTIIAAAYAVPNDGHVRRQAKMDWLGGLPLVAGLILTVFALTDGSHAPQKWANPYIITTLIVGVLLLCVAFYVEGWVAKNPLIDFSLFRIPHMKALFLGGFFTYGCLGVFLLYSTLYMSDIKHASPVLIAAYYVPMCVGGLILSIGGGYVMHLIPGTILIAVSATGWILSALLFAVAPADGSYWAYIFPAMIGATIGIDISYNVANIFITTSVSVKQQGLAGGIVNSLIYLGIAFFLACADITQTETIAQQGELGSLRNVFWLMFAMAVASLVIQVIWVRIPKAESELTVDEREALIVNDPMPGAGAETASGIELTRVRSHTKPVDPQ